MTLESFIAKMEGVRNDLQSGSAGVQTVLQAGCNSTLEVVRQRIHEAGKAADGSDIGQYNKTRPLYVNPQNAPVSFTPAGKILNRSVTSIKGKGKKKSSTGTKPHLDKYFESYDAFKSFIGGSGKVNLVLYGGLSGQFSVVAQNNVVGLGWLPGLATEGNRKSGLSYFALAQALEAKYGKRIWALTEQERRVAIETVSTSINQIVKHAIS
jgi:hypothetical protein